MILTILMYYMAIGAVVFVSLLVRGRLHRSEQAPLSFSRATEEETWKSRLANFFLIPLAVVFIFVPMWPLMLTIELNLPWHKFKFWTSKAARDMPWTTPYEEPEFSVRKEDLIEKLSRELVEAREMVIDPLDAVPALPFGHLNAAWTEFTVELDPGCELWSFQRHWQTQYRNNVFEGYVALRADKIGPHFVSGVCLLQSPVF